MPKRRAQNIHNTGTLVEDYNWATKLTNKRRGYKNQTPQASAKAEYTTFGNSGAWVETNTSEEVLTAGVQDGLPPSFDPRTNYWQKVQLHTPGEKAVRRWDMINPYWQTAQNPYGNNATNIEMLVNDQQNPLPFANDNFDQIEAQALDERFEAYKDPLSSRYAAYNIHPELEAVEHEYLKNKVKQDKPHGIPHYQQYHKNRNRPVDYTNNFGYTASHQFSEPTADDAVQKTLPIGSNHHQFWVHGSGKGSIYGGDRGKKDRGDPDNPGNNGDNGGAASNGFEPDKTPIKQENRATREAGLPRQLTNKISMDRARYAGVINLIKKEGLVHNSLYSKAGESKKKGFSEYVLAENRRSATNKRAQNIVRSSPSKSAVDPDLRTDHILSSGTTRAAKGNPLSSYRS